MSYVRIIDNDSGNPWSINSDVDEDEEKFLVLTIEDPNNPSSIREFLVMGDEVRLWFEQQDEVRKEWNKQTGQSV